MSTAPVKIIARPKPDPTRCDFELESQILAGRAEFDDLERAAGSPLAERLLALDGVEEVVVQDRTITVKKSDGFEWMSLAKLVGATLREVFTAGGPLLATGAGARAEPTVAAVPPAGRQPIRIIARPRANPDLCDFEVDREVHSGVAWFQGADSAQGSPLAEALFGLGTVTEVLVRGAIVTVTKRPDHEWADLARQVGATIRTQLETGAPPVAPNAGSQGLPHDDVMRQRVAEIVETEINPSVASHGGYITVRDVKAGVVTISMGGGCQGCSSSMATLKQGVETTLKRRVPGVLAVVDATDHNAGDNPYFH